MVKIVCVKKCVYAGRLYDVGEWISLPADGKVPAHFSYAPRITSKRRLSGSPGGPLPTDHKGKVILLADGPSLADYIDKVDEYQGLPIAAVNRAGVKWPGTINFWMTVHPTYFARWRKRRAKAGFKVRGIKYIAKAPVYNPEVIVVRDANNSGSSALFTLDVLFRMGFDHVHTVGLELSGPYEHFRPYWEEFVENGITGRVSADSGYIKELFKCRVK